MVKAWVCIGITFFKEGVGFQGNLLPKLFNFSPNHQPSLSS
jgi:hypothetical protein